jgi:hypothetical protein
MLGMLGVDGGRGLDVTNMQASCIYFNTIAFLYVLYIQTTLPIFHSNFLFHYNNNSLFLQTE